MAVTPRGISRRLWAICSLLAVAIFVVDQSLPLGVAGGVPYVAVIVLTARISGWRGTAFFAIACTVLTLAGFELSPAGGQLWQTIANRIVAVFAIWVTAALIYNNKKATEELVRSQADLALAQRMAGLGSWVRNLETGKVRCTREFYRLFGLNAAEPVSFETVTERIHQDDRDGFERAVKVALAERKPMRFTYRVVLPDGATKVIASRAEFVFDAAGKAICSMGSVQDITDEDALRKRDRLLTTILENSPAAIYLKDAEGRYLFANRRFEEWIGVSNRNLIGQTSHDLYPDSYAQNFVDHNREVVSTGKAVERSHEIPFADGSIHIVRATKFPACDENDRLVGVCTVTVDITETKKVEADLRISQKRLAAILAIAVEAIISVDQDQRIIQFNQGAEKIFGYAEAEVLGQPIDVLLPAEVRLAHREVMQQFVCESGVSRLMSERGEICAVRKDGSVFPAKASISRLDLDGEIILTAILRDISQYKDTEAALDWERTLVKTLMDAWPDLVFVKDRESRFLAANGKTAAVMGAKSPDELIGRTDGDFYDPEVAADFLASEQQLLETGQAVTGREESFTGPDGEQVWLSTTKLPLTNGGKIVGLVGINRDVTTRRLQERAVVTAKEQAEVANRAKSEFLANMSHELRTPLNAIIGFSEVIAKQSVGPVGDSRYCDYGRDINDAGQHLLELINDILDLSKVESGMDELHEEVVAVDEIAESVVRLLKDRAFQAGVDVVLKAPPDTPALFADARKLKQILANLLSNAVKFTETGGRVALSISCCADRGYLFQVCDTGIGIAREDIPKAMSMFGQVDGTLNRVHEGTGLGLPLTMALVELHGGEIEIESEVGAGTTVTVRFPASRTIASQSHTHVI